mmetsp:Transcript_50756/g.51161  ORF Transcript_50756/g.51161 Transcript_50756/m.51161 type:complete len:103 (-) Transcript_50756:381-689(-)
MMILHPSKEFARLNEPGMHNVMRPFIHHPHRGVPGILDSVKSQSLSHSLKTTKTVPTHLSNNGVGSIEMWNDELRGSICRSNQFWNGGAVRIPGSTRISRLL